MTLRLCLEALDVLLRFWRFRRWINQGFYEQFQGVNGIDLVIGRKSLAGSMIGGIAEAQEVINYCAARNIKAEIELIRPEEINRAFERVVSKEVRYRFVVDMASTKAAG
jgi:uncharacterized zinc-type alcohol dehydrogenase-like protein